MSCLALSELLLSEQIDIELALSARLIARTHALLARLQSSSPYPLSVPPCSGKGIGGDCNPLHHAEEPAMVEKMVHEHPPLQVCYPGHRAHLWQATGDRAVQYYVECSLCSVRTARYRSADDAAHAWGQRQVSPIVATVAA